MHIRRVVTAERGGNSFVLCCGPTSKVATFASVPGLEYHDIWATPAGLRLPLPLDDPAPGIASFRVDPGATHFNVVRLPSASELGESFEEDTEALMAEYRGHYPAFAEPGPDTAVCYGIVLAGTPSIELDSEEVELRPGDVVVQLANGRHWQNRGPDAAWIAFVSVGAS